jgi:hypothetical protein
MDDEGTLPRRNGLRAWKVEASSRQSRFTVVQPRRSISVASASKSYASRPRRSRVAATITGCHAPA